MQFERKDKSGDEIGRVKRSNAVLSLIELAMQCILFASFIFMAYLGIYHMTGREFLRSMWVIPAVVFLFIIRKKTKKFSLFMLSNILVFVAACVVAENDSQLFANLVTVILLCAYSIWLKNNTIQRLSPKNMIVSEGRTLDDAEAALSQIYAGEDMNVFFVASPAFGYIIGVWQNVPLLVNIEVVFCILFIVLKIVYNNLSHLDYVLNLNRKKKDFPAKQIKQVNKFVTVTSAVLISLGMLLFYNGQYGNIFELMGRGVGLVVRLVVKFFIFLLGTSGFDTGSMGMPQNDTETEESLEEIDLEMPDSPIMQAIFEAFGLVLVIAIVIALIYMVRTYIKNFNRTKKLGNDYIEYIVPNEDTQHVNKMSANDKKNAPRDTRSVRRMYKKRVLKGTGGKPPEPSAPPSSLTLQNITDNEELAEKITAVYEKARYSEERITPEEASVFKDI